MQGDALAWNPSPDLLRDIIEGAARRGMGIEAFLRSCLDAKEAKTSVPVSNPARLSPEEMTKQLSGVLDDFGGEPLPGEEAHIICQD